MAEPEDLILDGAYVATRFARDLWRRYAPPAQDDALRLGDMRARLEMFLHALFEREIPIATAEADAPVSWLARVAGRHGTESAAGVLPATDGIRIYLPEAVASSSLFTFLAVEQAVRVVRESASVAAAIQHPALRQRFALAEATAADAWIVRETPGLVPVLRSARRHEVARRSSSSAPAQRGAALEPFLQNWLAHDPTERCDDVPVCATAAESLRWAMQAGRDGKEDAEAFRRELPPVYYWGRFLAPAKSLVGTACTDTSGPQPHAKQRVAEMRRRPRIREADDEEDDAGAGTWVIRADEPQESVEDPFGLQRPADRDAHADPEGLGDALSDLPEARVVRSPGQAREVLRAGDEPPRTIAAVTAPAEIGIAYPEWDYRSGTYKSRGAVVHEIAVPFADAAWTDSARSRLRSTIRRVRSRFERLRPRRVRVGRQPDGPEIDVAEYVKTAADSRAGVSTEDGLYIDVHRARRELSVALLVDASASTDAWVSGTQRIVDVEKDALLVVVEALAALGDRHAIYAFCGHGPEHVSVLPLQRFGEPGSSDVIHRIGALDADGYTRLGAAVRHVTAAISRERSERRLLLVLSDGKPNDIDQYEGVYGIEDARQAVGEARAQGIDVFCVTVDREAPRYAARIFGAAGFTALRRADQLPQVLVEALRRLIRPRR